MRIVRMCARLSTTERRVVLIAMAEKSCPDLDQTKLRRECGLAGKQAASGGGESRFGSSVTCAVSWLAPQSKIVYVLVSICRSYQTAW
jgi:hypothetical protein